MKHLLKVICLTVLLTFVVSGFVLAGDDIAKFQKIGDKMAKAVLTDDHQTLMAMYEDDAYSLPSYAPILKGKKAMAEHAKKQHEAGMKMKTFSLKVVDVFGDDQQKIVVGTYDLTIILPGMKEAMPDKGKWLNVWNKQKDGSWKIKAGTWNSDVNPMEMMKNMQQK
ncbi:MAG: SgcJ/EcaC family oxidoreductase [bacterium]|nr:SgcJ/EcaC family oxidoreductase [bacterium]